MIKRTKVLLLILSAIFYSCHAQPPIWSKTRNWKIYALAGQKIFTLPIDSIRALKNKSLDNNIMQFFLTKAAIIPKERTPVWMGAYLASYETEDGNIRKVEVSAYGGFFYDESSSLYFLLPHSIRDEWINYISGSITLLKQN